MHKVLSLFQKQCAQRTINERVVWVAHYDGQMAGYVTLKWQSHYEVFAKNKIPEIIDLSVLPPFRKCGVGSELLEAAEREASK